MVSRALFDPRKRQKDPISYRRPDRTLLNTVVMRIRPHRARDRFGARGVQVRNGTAPITLDFDARCHITYRRLRVNDERRKRCLTRH